MRSKSVLLSVLLFSAIILSSASFAADRPLPPKDLFADVSDSSVVLSWTPPIDTTIAGFNLYRREDISGTEYVRVNDRLLVNPSFSDKTVKRGKSYDYVCRSINSDGIESNNSNVSGAPKIKMTTSALVTHMGRPVRIAVPGDVIRYDIDFANNGFGIAKEVIIVYAIPKGTTIISGTAKCPNYKVNVSYFSEDKNQWLSTVDKEESISRVKFAVLESVPPVEKGSSGIASVKVVVNY